MRKSSFFDTIDGANKLTSRKWLSLIYYEVWYGLLRDPMLRLCEGAQLRGSASMTIVMYANMKCVFQYQVEIIANAVVCDIHNPMDHGRFYCRCTPVK